MAEGHVAAGLLVAGAVGADPVAALLQGVEQRIELGAGKPEDAVDAIGDQRLDDRHAAGHAAARAHDAPQPTMGMARSMLISSQETLHRNAIASTPARRAASKASP